MTFIDYGMSVLKNRIDYIPKKKKQDDFDSNFLIKTDLMRYEKKRRNEE